MLLKYVFLTTNEGRNFKRVLYIENERFIFDKKINYYHLIYIKYTTSSYKIHLFLSICLIIFLSPSVF